MKLAYTSWEQIKLIPGNHSIQQMGAGEHINIKTSLLATRFSMLWAVISKF